MIANIMSQIGAHTNAQIEENLVRHMVLNTIRAIRLKFLGYGETIIAADNRKYWRREVFPFYKAGRKKAREATDTDWPAIFNCLNTVRQELHDNFPYRVLCVERAEADDVIGTLCIEYGEMLNSNNRIAIISADKDFVQLQTFGNVEQYDPINKKAIKHPNPQQFLIEHIVRGDRGDGVPNILSDDDVFVTEDKRQRKVTQKVIDQWLNPSFRAAHEDDANYRRNCQLINLMMVPRDLQNHILEEYHQQANKPRTKMFNYFVTHRLKNLISDIGDF